MLISFIQENAIDLQARWRWSRER